MSYNYDYALVTCDRQYTARAQRQRTTEDSAHSLVYGSVVTCSFWSCKIHAWWKLIWLQHITGTDSTIARPPINSNIFDFVNKCVSLRLSEQRIRNLEQGLLCVNGGQNLGYHLVLESGRLLLCRVTNKFKTSQNVCIGLTVNTWSKIPWHLIEQANIWLWTKHLGQTFDFV